MSAAVCPICGKKAKQAKVTTGDYLEFDCTECGRFQMSRTYERVASETPAAAKRQSLVSATMRARYGSLPLITTYDLP